MIERAAVVRGTDRAGWGEDGTRAERRSNALSGLERCRREGPWVAALPAPRASMRRFALSTGKEPRETSVPEHLRPGFHPHSLRRLCDAVLFEVRPFRRCSLTVGLALRPALGRSRRELSVWACPLLSLPFLYLANAYRSPRAAQLIPPLLPLVPLASRP